MEQRRLTSSDTTCALSSVTVRVPKVARSDLNIVEQIGHGAFGMVHKASWIETTVAVKELVGKRTKMARSKIERKSNIHSQIRHSNILQLMAYAMEFNRVYLVT